jgi:hypothetical protein
MQSLLLIGPTDVLMEERQDSGTAPIGLPFAAIARLSDGERVSCPEFFEDQLDIRSVGAGSCSTALRGAR